MTAAKVMPTPRVGMEPVEIADRATDMYATLCKRFRATGTPPNFDFRRHCVEWTARGDHLTHRLHRYPGRLTPYIPLFFLAVRGIGVSFGRLLDPFAGCGTVLVEAPAHPVHPMHPVGLEINPLARLIAKVKTTPLERRAIFDCWERIVARYNVDTSRAGLASFPNKRHWFTSVVERRLARVLRAIEGLRDPDLRDFFLVAISSVVRHVALADPNVSVPVKIDPNRFDDAMVRKHLRANLRQRQDADVLAILEATVRGNTSRLRAWMDATSILVAAPTIVGADARTFAANPYIGAGNLASTRSKSLRGIDLVLTSPPYANAQRYTRSLRLELFVLGYTTDGEDESALDRLQIGTERVPYSEWEGMVEPTGSRVADKTIRLLLRRDHYRAAIVGKFVRDMKTVLGNCYHALRPGGHAVFVIGNNCIRGRLLDNAEILGELGEQVGFTQRLRIRNKIPSRGLLTKRHPTAGVITHEHVLVLRKPASRRQGVDV